MSKYSKAILGTAMKAAVGLAIVAGAGTQAYAQTEILIGRTTGASGFHIPSYLAAST